MRTLTDTIPYTGPTFDAKAGIITMGPGLDTGHAAWRLYQPGLMLSGVITRSRGMGASRLLDLLAHSAMCSGTTVVWYADQQGGVSSPGLARAADRAALDSDEIRAMFAAARRIAAARAAEQHRRGERGFTPSRETPGVLILVEELWAQLYDPQLRSDLEQVLGNDPMFFARSGVAFAATMQDSSLGSFGKSSHLRNAIAHQMVALHQRSSRSNVPDLIDRVPAVPGYGCHYLFDGTSADPSVFRAAYLGDATEADRRWFTRVPTAARARLDTASAAAAAHTA